MSQPSSTTAITLLVASTLLTVPAWASDAAAAKAKPTSAKRAKLVQPQGGGTPVAVLADLSPEQIASADRVLLGSNACEFNQAVDVKEAPEKKGYFRLLFKGKSYTMVPEPTTTGAIRLEDKLNGLVWLQIANKSMLMNARIGQRMVDNCVHPSQKAS